MGSWVKQFFKKYGGVALGVHASVSATSFAGLYVAIKNNVDVESYIEKWNIPGFFSSSNDSKPHPSTPGNEGNLDRERISNQSTDAIEISEKNRTAKRATSAGGALAMALLCNKLLFPIRAPITVVLTPPVTRFLARRKIAKGQCMSK